MKRVVTGNLLEESMIESITVLCDTVAKTLGPIGGNVLINESERTPYITNDGVTIAMNIESEDKVVNTILEIAKEASLKTNELVGDGTTTTLVLLKTLYLEGLKLVRNGKKRIVLKREMESICEKLKKEISSFCKKASLEDLKHVAIVSASSSEIGDLVFEIMQKVSEKSAVRILESPNEKTYYEIKEGYRFEISTIADYYFRSQKEIVLNECSILLLNDYLNDLEKLSELLNECIDDKKSLLIISDGASTEIKQALFSVSESVFIFVVELPDYFSLKCQILEDLSILTNASIVDFTRKINFSDLGFSGSVHITKEEVLLHKEEREDLKEYVNSLKKLLSETKEEYQQELLRERIHKLENGISFLYVGGVTKTEKKERHMRFEDAFCAYQSAKSGVVLGSGVSFLKVSRILNKDNEVENVFLKSLEKPFETILENAGIEHTEIKKKIVEEDFQTIYNVLEQTFEDTSLTKIIDPYLVLLNALENAVSIATMLLTTESLVLLEKEVINPSEM